MLGEMAVDVAIDDGAGLVGAQRGGGRHGRGGRRWRGRLDVRNDRPRQQQAQQRRRANQMTGFHGGDYLSRRQVVKPLHNCVVSMA
jgi:hypothetical protein